MAAALSIAECFSHVKDPRVNRTKLHALDEILVITICAVICGVDSWSGVELFGHLKEDWLRTFLKLPNGIPSHDTIGRVFSALDPRVFEAAFSQWLRSSIETKHDVEVIAIDGKTMRRTFDTALEQSPLHMVSAVASSSGIVLGQRACDAKSNEITAIPQLLEQLFIRGAIVTIDAMGCQTEIAAQIRRQDGDYVLALKGNQGDLHTAVKEYFDWACDDVVEAQILSHHAETDGGHGRVAERRCWGAPVDDWMIEKERWIGFRSVFMVENICHHRNKTTSEKRYFISSLPHTEVARVNNAIRRHWCVESMHWVLDVTFNEDQIRIRKGNAAECFGIILRAAINILRKDKTSKASLPQKMLKAALSDAYRGKIMGI